MSVRMDAQWLSRFKLPASEAAQHLSASLGHGLLALRLLEAAPAQAT